MTNYIIGFLMFSIIIYIAYDSDVLRFSKKEDHRKLSKEEIDEINAYNGVFEQCFQKYLNTFDKNIF